MDLKERLWETGIFTLSLDTELAWGAADKPRLLTKNMIYYRKTRKVIDCLLELMDKYQIPATWAVVGHLFLDCPGVGWGDNERETDLWFGRDIIERIRTASTEHEIASHSFSHLIFNDKNTTGADVERELKQCLREAEKLGLQLESFVFPRNREGYLGQLAGAGFKTFRSLEPSWYRDFPDQLRKICHIIDQLLALPPPVTYPIKRGGMLDIPASMLYLPRNGFRKYIPLKSRTVKAVKGMRRAAKQKKLFHLWFHPFNIATDPENLLFGLEVIFEEVQREREKGNLQVKTMRELLDLC
jgi:hypothetical protein